MCSSCNKSYSEWRTSDKFKWLDKDQIQLILLKEILESLHRLEDKL